MTDCIFCKIINGEIPSSKVYEDEEVYAFLDISQTTAGHTLVVPKVHVEDIFAYSDELAAQVMARLPKVARALDAAFPEMKGLNVLSNNREMAYQTVFHSHWHLIPRYSQEDGFKLMFTQRTGEMSGEELNQMAANIASHIE
ncbi:HIT family protein [Aerococcaceae bacterium zg-ZJ1578]|uniref:HIT family protein n=1 Tax=Aerococcaceae bacterium zg-252 TaxID=2796928 RepID=UPI001A244B75|nr:HIT family protein [Aerococcaceae bacterium zg-1578]